MATTLSPADRAKRAAALAALEYIEDGMTLGLGTGSTAAFLVEGLGRRMGEGLKVRCVATSSGTAAQATRLSIPLLGLDEAGPLDLVIDGADEFDPQLRLIKGGGGALLQEKIVAAAARRMVVISDASKEVARLGAFPLPIEVVRFGCLSTARTVATVLDRADVETRTLTWRQRDGAFLVTDEGHHILDAHLGRIGDPGALASALVQVPGVVETGLFLGLASEVLIGSEDGHVRRFPG